MTNPTITGDAARRLVWLPAGILLIALVLRLVGIDFGLPAVYNPDEVAIMSRALAFAKGDLNPHNFLYPSFYFYVLFAWVGGYYVVARLAGTVASLQAFQAQFFTNPTGIYLAGRALSVVCGVLTVLLVFRLASRLFGRIAGLAAALVMAVAPFAVRDAHYVKHDIPATLAVVAAYLAMLRLEERRDAPAGKVGWRDAAVAGAACGVAFSIHYYTVFLAFPLAFVALGSRGTWPHRLRVIAVAAAASAGVFVALSPFLPFELRTALTDMAANREIVVDRALQSGGWIGGAQAYARMLWQDAIGWPSLLLGLGGLVVLARRSPRRAVWLMAFPVTFLLFITHTVPATRYLNPVLPFIAILAGLAVSRASLFRGGPHVGVAAALCILASVPGAREAWATSQFFRQSDTRTLAQRYVEANITPGASIALQPSSVPLTQSRASLVEALRRSVGDERRASTKFAIRLALDPYPQPSYRTIFLGSGGLDADKIYVDYADLGGARGLEALRALQVTFVIVKRYNAASPETVPFLDALATEGRLLASFSPLRSGGNARAQPPAEPFLHNQDARIVPELQRPGPRVEVWQLNDRH